MKDKYYYKDKPYSITGETKIKIGGEWIPVIHYQCEYENKEGKNWTRFKTEFFELFKLKI